MRHFIAVLLFLIQGSPAATYYSDPATGTAAGDGSAEAPWPRLQEVTGDGKLAKLQGGDTLLLRSGNHGDVKLSGDNATLVTIAAAAGQHPQLSRLVITKGTNWRLRGLTISPSFAASPYEGNIVTLAEGGPSRELVLEDCFIYTVLDSTKWTAAEWIKANSGVFLGRHGTRLTLRNNYLLNTRFAVSLCSPDSLCEGNIITNFSGDGIRITRDDITVQYNTVRNCFVGPEQGDDNHDDLMQCFLFNKGTGTVRNAIIRGNMVKNNMACSFNLKADPGVVAENNIPVDDAKFDRRLKEQEREINEKFGVFHPVAKLSRLGMRTGEYKAPVTAPVPAPYNPGREIAKLANQSITESSGLACSRATPGVFWTHNDSGDQPRLFAFNLKGEDLGTYPIRGASAHDWEDMCSFSLAGKHLLLVADTGDNNVQRKIYTIYIAPEPAINTKPAKPQVLSLFAQQDFTYEDGPHNCESVAVDPVRREIVLVSKTSEAACKAYVLPLPLKKSPGNAVAKSVATLNIPTTTAMDISPDGLRALVLTYGDAYEYTRHPEDDWSRGFARQPRVIKMPARRQGESACYGSDGVTIYLTSEKTPTPLLEVAPSNP